MTFASPDASNPTAVLWGHFDGDDGGIGSLPNLLGPLRLDFEMPVSSVGFRNRGFQPGINIQYFDIQGQLVGEVLASASSFVGVTSSESIAYLLVQENPPIPSAGQRQQPAYITALHFNVAPVDAVPEPTTALMWLSGLALATLPCLKPQKTFLSWVL